jgi:hypothetical protein
VAWSRLQSAASAVGATNPTATFGSNVSSGTTIIAAVSLSDSECGDVSLSTVCTCADNNSNSLTFLGGYVNGTSGYVGLFAMTTPAGDVGTKPTITATVNATISADNFGCVLLIQEISGLAGISLDGSIVEDTGTTTAVTIGSYGSAVANEYLMVVYGDPGYTRTISTPSGYSPDANNIADNGDAELSVFYKNSAGGTESASMTLSGAADWTTLVVAFQISGGAAAAPAYRGSAQFSPSHRVRYHHGINGPVPRLSASSPSTAGYVPQQYAETLVAQAALYDTENVQASRGLSALITAGGVVTRGAARIVNAVIVVVGLVSRQAARVLAAALASAAATAESALKSLAGTTAVTSGVVTAKLRELTLIALAVAADALGRGVSRAVAASTAVTGVIPRGVARAVSGVAVAGGGVFKTAGKPLALIAAAIPVAGKIAGKPFATVIVVVAAASRGVARYLAAPAAAAGTSIKAVSRAVTVIVAASSSMALQKFKQVILSAAAVVNSAMTRQIGKLTVAPVAAGVIPARQVTRGLVAAAGVYAAAGRGALKRLLGSAAISPAVSALSAVTHYLTAIAQLAVSGVARSFISRALAAQLAAAAVTTRGLGRTIAGGAAAAGAVVKAVTRSLTGIASATASSGFIKVHLLTMQTLSVVNGVIVRKMLPNIIATAIMGSVVSRVINRAIQGNFSAAGQTLRGMGRTFTATTSAEAAVSRIREYIIAAGIFMLATVNRGVRVAEVAPAVLTPVAARVIRRVFTAPAGALAGAIPGRAHLISFAVAVAAPASVAVKQIFSAFVVTFKSGIAFLNWVAGQAKSNWKIP